MNYIIEPRKVGWVLATLATYLALQSLIGEYLLEIVLAGESSTIVAFIDLFSVNLEDSIPTWFSTLLLFLSNVLLTFIWGVKKRKDDRWKSHWLGLAIIFLFLSIDEGAGVHESTIDLIESFVETSGYLAFSWQILYFPLILIFGVIYFRFLRHLPTQTIWLFTIAAAIYVGGAMFVEAISANRWYLDGGISFRYLFIATIEEWLEMLGASIFIYALLDFIVVGRYAARIEFFPVTQSISQWLNTPQLKKSFLVCGLSIIILNLIFIGSAWTQKPEETTVVKGSSLATIAAEFAAEDVIVLQYKGAIDSRRAASLINLFDDVLVVSDPNEETYLVFAGPALPFNRADLEAAITGRGAQVGEILNSIDLIQLASER